MRELRNILVAGLCLFDRLHNYPSFNTKASNTCCVLSPLQVLGNLPFNILVAVLYSGIFYGMCGLRRGGEHFAKFATIVTLLQIISAQVGCRVGFGLG